MEKVIQQQSKDYYGLCFANLVDFDMKYGHRRDIDGYAAALTAFDKQLGQFMEKMNRNDILIITADHGCDPGAAGTDHTREYVPLIIYGEGVAQGINLGTRDTFADIGATILDLLGVENITDGRSFREELLITK